MKIIDKINPGSISGKLGMSLASVIAVLFVILGIIAYTASYLIQVRQLEVSARSTLERFSESLIDPVWNLNSDEVKRLTSIYLQPEIISSINIEFSDQRIFQSKESGVSEKLISRDLFHRGESIGRVTLSYTDSIIISRLNAAALAGLAVLAVLLAGVLFSVRLIISRILQKPVKRLADSIGVIASGDYSHVLNRTGRIEIDMIVDSINYMSNQIYQRDSDIREGKNLLNDVIESITAMIAAVDSGGKITLCNSSFAEFIGTTVDVISGKLLSEAAPVLKRFSSGVEEVLAAGITKHYQRESFDGAEERWFRLSIYPLLSSRITGYIMVIEEITELVKKEEQLRQAQKMETIGALAGGLAHDFNNALGGITGIVSLLKHGLSGGRDLSKDEILEMLQLIDDSGGRAADMVQQLLSLSRIENLCLRRSDLRDALNRVIKLCSRTFDRSVRIVSELISGDVSALIDKSGIEQVLFNISINAAHSMTIMRGPHEPQGGTLTFTLKELEADRHFVLSHPEALEIKYHMISIRDTGVGIKNKHKSKIFEPFFTTKEKGKGTGLGLSMVYNIVKLHDGFLDVYSEEGIGTVFNVYIPACTGETGPEDLQPEKVYTGSGLILVADDDPVIRMISESILRECGYDVITAVNGAEAVDLYNQRRADIDLVLMDLVMPAKNGFEAFTAMKKINTDVKMIMMSGFRQDSRIDQAVEEGAADFIQKPFTFNELSAIIHRVLY